MMMMMDVSEGDCVLESGSGSGAMSLFLSRAGMHSIHVSYGMRELMKVDLFGNVKWLTDLCIVSPAMHFLAYSHKNTL